MREGQPSVTARLVSFARGVGLAAEAPDPLADRVLPRLAGAVVAAARVDALRPFVRDASRMLTLGFVDHVTLRTLAIDRAVTRAVERGIRQCVLLGAGLDTRAHRLEALSAVRTFELDHPATQTEKRRRMTSAGLSRADLVYVPIDFQRESLAEVLEAAGHDAHAPTMWIWEGVTMYLPAAATRATLEQVARRSAPSSQLALTYMVPGSIPFGAVGETLVRPLFRAVGEPLGDGYTRRDMSELLRTFGFDPLSDTSSVEWASSAGLARALPLVYRGERLALACAR
jgi:methyltransferase (TIGR00027 family)